MEGMGTGRSRVGFHTEVAYLLCPMGGKGTDRRVKRYQRWSQPSVGSTTAFWGLCPQDSWSLGGGWGMEPRLGHVAAGGGWGQVGQTDAGNKERSRGADWPPWLSPVRRSPDLQARSTSFSKSVCKTETKGKMRVRLVVGGVATCRVVGRGPPKPYHTSEVTNMLILSPRTPAHIISPRATWSGHASVCLSMQAWMCLSAFTCMCGRVSVCLCACGTCAFVRAEDCTV